MIGPVVDKANMHASQQGVSHPLISVLDTLAELDTLGDVPAIAERARELEGTSEVGTALAGAQFSDLETAVVDAAAFASLVDQHVVSLLAADSSPAAALAPSDVSAPDVAAALDQLFMSSQAPSRETSDTATISREHFADQVATALTSAPVATPSSSPSLGVLSAPPPRGLFTPTGLTAGGWAPPMMGTAPMGTAPMGMTGASPMPMGTAVPRPGGQAPITASEIQQMIADAKRKVGSKKRPSSLDSSSSRDSSDERKRRPRVSTSGAGSAAGRAPAAPAPANPGHGSTIMAPASPAPSTGLTATAPPSASASAASPGGLRGGMMPMMPMGAMGAMGGAGGKSGSKSTATPIAATNPYLTGEWAKTAGAAGGILSVDGTSPTEPAQPTEAPRPRPRFGSA